VFGSNQTATSDQYATFVLRALGYDDAAGDFSWDKSLDKMVSLGILTGAQAASFSSKGLRGHIAAISYLSLSAHLKESGMTMLEKLFLVDSAISRGQLLAAAAYDTRLSMLSNALGVPKPYPTGAALTSEEVFAKASDAVFLLETKVLTESDLGTGSGFFITSDGIAVTNKHVIDFMSSASIKTTDGSTYPVEGVLAIGTDADIAIIKVKGSGFPYLEVGDPSLLRAAQRIYCVGSPYGLDNSISDGLVSNPRRLFEGQTYIQISAPIAPGSSGGALLNEYGQVVGITAAGYDQGSVNLAVPITDLAGVFRFSEMRSVMYLQAHSHFDTLPITDITYSRIDSDDDKPIQTMQRDTIMYGTIRGAGDVHYYALNVRESAEMLVSLTSSVRNSAGLRFEVSDPSGNVILKSRHYGGEVFSIAKGLGASKGLYTVKIYVEDSGEDWSCVKYELFWMYHITYEESLKSLFFLEFEPNDTPEHANYLPDYSIYGASISSKSDVDYYTFTLASRSIYIAAVFVNGAKSILNAEIFDSGNKSVGKFSFDGDSEYFEAWLPAGTYYIRVSAKNADIVWDNVVYAISGWYV